MNSEEIKKEMGEIVNVIKEYSNVKDQIVDESFFELLEDSMGLVKVLQKAYYIAILHKFKHFLNGISFEEPIEDELIKLKKYITNKKRANYIGTVFSNIVSSNSEKVCFILGLLTQEMTGKDKDIDQSELLIINAVNGMNDFDITNFTVIYEEGLVNKETDINGYVFLNEKYTNEDILVNTNLELTLLLCERLGLFLKRDLLNANGMIRMNMAYYQCSHITDKFYRLAKLANTYAE